MSPGGTTAQTNARGFFQRSIEAPARYSAETGALIEVTFSKNGYQRLTRRNARVSVGSVRKYRVSLRRGSGTSVVEEMRGRQSGLREDSPPGRSGGAALRASVGALSLPASIRVGQNCNTSTSCTTVNVVQLDVYAKHVLPQKSYPSSWNMESLKAGNVAIRAVGVWYTGHPKSARYDICDTTACQVYDPDVTDSSTDAAVDSTAKRVLVDHGTRTVTKAEFSAENNNAGCGNGRTGTGTSGSPCIDDFVCTGKTLNGHGRGMCQTGSHRWATGKNADGSAASGGPRDMVWFWRTITRPAIS